MIVGVDLKKRPAILEAAYDDPAGITEAFIRNILERANSELSAGFDIGAFDYTAAWNAEDGRVEMELINKQKQSVVVGGTKIEVAAGERIHVENSHKYGLEEFTLLARQAGFSGLARYVDPDRLFSVHILSVD